MVIKSIFVALHGLFPAQKAPKMVFRLISTQDPLEELMMLPKIL